MAYYRVSTREQGDSGLGIEAQKNRVSLFLKGERPAMEFTEVESGKNDDRSELKKALDMCKKHGHTLLIAKLDRLSRNLTFISSMMDAKIKFVCADMPEANEFTIHIFAALAQAERKMISERTKAALKALRDKGVKLGNPNAKRDLGGKRAQEASLAAKKKKRDNNGSYTKATAMATALRKNGMKLVEIAGSMNENGFHAPKGGKMTATQVSRMIQNSERSVKQGLKK